MSLRTKTIIMILMGAGLVLGSFYAVSQLIFMRSFETIEKRDANRAVAQVASVFSDRINNLNTLNHDWAAWDDTYNFVQHPEENQNYIDVNPTDSTFANAKLNILLILNKTGQLVYGRDFDLKTGNEIPMPDSLVQYFTSKFLLHPASEDESVSGVALLPEGTLLLSAQPIMTSQGQGPIMGTIIMAQFLNADVISTLSAVAHLPIDIVTVNDRNLTPDAQMALASISSKTSVFLHILDSHTINGYEVQNDVFGNKALLIKTSISRDVYDIGTNTIRYFFAAAVLIAALVSVLVYLAMGRLVTSRISNIGNFVQDLGESGNLAKRMTVDGNDELSRLGRSINRMVDAMQKSQQALQIRQQEEERLRLTIESVAEAIASTDLEGKIIDVNDSKIKLHGYSNKLELVGHNALELVSSEDLPKAKENMRMALETGYSDGGEYTMLKKDGTTFSAERSTALLKNPEGKPAGFVISTKDITERRRTEEALTLSEQNFRNSLNNSPMGVTIADGDFNTVYVNQTFLDIFGYKNLGEVKASPPQEHYTPGSYAEYLKRREQRSRGEPNPDSVEIDVIRQDGTIRHLQIFLKNVLWDGKQQYQTLYTDITERKEATDQLARLNAELKSFNSQLESKVQERTSQLEEAVSVAEASNQAKSEFLASMSHELRTPLNAIIGFSEVLRERYFGDLNPKQSEYIVDIVDSGKHLLSLINDILDLSKIEAGKMDLELSRFKIADLLRSSLVMIKEKALAHNLTLDIQIPDDINELLITADERRIKQVMFNLLSNSAKFTPDGGSIKLEAHYQGADLVISVSDTGIGMTSQEQKRLFEAFYQASGGIKGKTPGTGLGLAITRSIIEKHGGKIWMESKGTNMGSTFTFTLPVKALTPVDIV